MRSRDNIYFIQYGMSYKLIHRTTPTENLESTAFLCSSLGSLAQKVEAGCEPENTGASVSREAMEALYQDLKIHFEGSKDPTKEHQEDIRKIAFGLLETVINNSKPGV